MHNHDADIDRVLYQVHTLANSTVAALPESSLLANDISIKIHGLYQLSENDLNWSIANYE